MTFRRKSRPNRIFGGVPSCPRRLVKSARSFFEREEDIRGDRDLKVVKVIKDFKVGGQRQTKGCENG